MKIIRPPLFMRPTPESELEQAVDRELRRLPDLRAPDDLIPRVLRALAERQARPWWCQSIVHWPWLARSGFLAFTTGLAGLLFYFTWGLGNGISLGVLTDEIAQLSDRIEISRTIVGSLAGALVAVARSAGPWLPWTAIGVVAASYLTTLALGTYCYRLACERS